MLNQKQMLSCIEDLVPLMKTAEDVVLFVPDQENITEDEVMDAEKNLLGYFITKHPLENYTRRLEQLTSVEELHDTVKHEYTDGEVVRMGGIISDYKQIVTKKGKEMCFFNLEDATGRIEVVVFPSLFARHRSMFAEMELVEIVGKIEVKTEEGVPGEGEDEGAPPSRSYKLMLNNIKPLEKIKEVVAYHIELGDHDEYENILNLLQDNPGELPVRVEYGRFILETPYKISQSSEVIPMLKNICLIKEEYE